MYKPRNFPTTPEQYPAYIDQELHNIAKAMVSAVDFLELEVKTVPPLKPRRGRIYYADGTAWNPGSGEGVYRYNGSAYVFLG